MLDGDRGWLPYAVDAEVSPASRAPLSPRGGPVASESPILVQLASFRDARCGRTIWDAFSRASNPARVHFAVVDQVDAEAGDASCVEQYCALVSPTGAPGAACPGSDRILVDALPASASHGPAMARARQLDLVNQMYSRDGSGAGFLPRASGEGGSSVADVGCHGFCLQLDAHSLFRRGWDSLLIASWMAVGNEFAVLTTYPPNVDQRDLASAKEAELFEVPTLCRVQPGKTGVPRNTIASAARHMPRPFLGPLWGAGLSFGKCHGDRAVPADPLLLGVFDGEEFSRGARLWTSGYDLYSAHRNFVFHDYGRGGIRGDGGWRNPTASQQENRDRPPSAAEEEGGLARVAQRLDACTSAAGRYAVAEQFMQPALSTERLKHVLGAEEVEEAVPPHLWESSPGGAYGLGLARPLDAYARHIGAEGEGGWARLFGFHQGQVTGMCGQRSWVPFDVRCTYLGVLGADAPGCPPSHGPLDVASSPAARRLLTAPPRHANVMPMTSWDRSGSPALVPAGIALIVLLASLARIHARRADRTSAHTIRRRGP